MGKQKYWKRWGHGETKVLNSLGTTSQKHTTSSATVLSSTASVSTASVSTSPSTGMSSRGGKALKVNFGGAKTAGAVSVAVTPVRHVKGGRAVLLNQSLDWGCCAAQAGVCVSQAVGRCGKSHAYRRSEWRTGVPAGGADRQTGMSAWPHGSSRT